MPPRSSARPHLAALLGVGPRPERRQVRRLTPGRLTPCLITAAPEAEPVPDWVCNLFVRGAGLVAGRPFDPGAVLPVLINAGHTFAAAVELRVVRRFRAVSGDFFLGGEFTQPLSSDALLPFLL
jgi:hypothetical protein